jgi:hypothetical protein
MVGKGITATSCISRFLREDGVNLYSGRFTKKEASLFLLFLSIENSCHGLGFRPATCRAECRTTGAVHFSAVGNEIVTWRFLRDVQCDVADEYCLDPDPS